jgi:hypothetical protein
MAAVGVEDPHNATCLPSWMMVLARWRQPNDGQHSALKMTTQLEQYRKHQDMGIPGSTSTLKDSAHRVPGMIVLDEGSVTSEVSWEDVFVAPADAFPPLSKHHTDDTPLTLQEWPSDEEDDRSVFCKVVPQKGKRGAGMNFWTKGSVHETNLQARDDVQLRDCSTTERAGTETRVLMA